MNRLLGFLVIFLCLISTSSADEQHEALHRKLLYSLYGKEVTPFALITIPKSGAPLMLKSFYYMSEAIPHWQGGIDPNFKEYYRALWKHPNQYSFLCTHFWISPNFEGLCNSINLKRVVCIRDLRDVCISIVYHIQKNGWPGINGLNPKAWNAFRQLSFDEQLLFVINYEYDPVSIGEEHWQLSLPFVARQAVQYCKKPNVLVCAYESLVGEKGGGTKNAQLITLRRLNQFLNFGLSEEKLIEISSKIYGVEQTPLGTEDEFAEVNSPFQSVKIGTWKEVFKEEHKEAFKKKLGWALIALGYEKNNNW